MIDLIAYMLGMLFGTFGPAIVLALLTAIAPSKEK